MTSPHDPQQPARTRPQNTAPTPPATPPASTRAQGRQAGPGTTRQSPPSPPSPRSTRGTHDDTAAFPAELTHSYTPVDLVGTGAEGAVWRVVDARTHAELAIKVHWDNQPMDPDLLRHLDNAAFHRHVPAITDHGRLTTSAGTRDWVAMEYLPVNLADVLATMPAVATSSDTDVRERAHAIIAELCALIAFWQQQVDRNPLDFKPANILVRRTGTEPGQFVIADFGGIHRFTASQLHGGASRFNLAYAPPEHTWSEHAGPWPWWGLGEIAYELACGQPRYRHRDGGVKDDAEILRGQILGDRGASIPDEHWRRLVRGLLTVDPADRWGAAEVQAWLNGEEPEVAEDRAGPAVGDTPGPTAPAPTVTFGRLQLSDPAEVAAQILDRGEDAAHWLLAEGGAHQLAHYLDQLGEHTYDTTQLHRLEQDPDRAHLAVTALGAAFAPELTPTYAGRAVDTAGLVELAGTEPGFLRRLLSQPEAMRTIAVYACGHPECRRVPRCDRIQRLAAEAPQLARQAEEDTAQLGERLTAADATGEAAPPEWGSLSDAEHDHAHALATLAVLDPASLRTQVEQMRPTALLGPHWWRRQVLSCDTSDTPTGRRSMVVALLLADRAAVERARLAQRPQGGVYAKSLWHRVVTGVLAGLALINAVWAGAGSFDDIGVVLANVFPLIVVTSTIVALWPWPSAERAPRALTALSWASGLLAAATYRGLDGSPPTHAQAWWPAPDWLVGFLGLLPAPFQVTTWWFPTLIAVTVVMLAIKFVRFRMRLAYRERYVHFWDTPRLGPTPEERLGLAPLLAVTWLGIVIVGTVTAGVAHSTSSTITLALAGPPLAYLAVYLAVGAGLLYLSTPRKLVAWTVTAVVSLASCGWVQPLRLVEVWDVGPLQATWLILLGLGMLGGAALYARTRLSPRPIPSI
ncbi:hypothetical protein RIF23_02360 [Lipingzhangella sp. LS1_29]|uniref:non-specific serine/threonine protein kinase n=1 Tax=Lipingzhangella rawalii TaxID=2055835 RepID=A0ABU2H2T6_9ACTN|nr:hypothetical protein [Lipingzhangella rawalii]MDS1269135.1 hypothetical protein [Lipingzhangella rawalii]